MAHLLRLRTKAPPRTKCSKGQKHKHNGVAGRVGNGSQPPVWTPLSEETEEWSLQALEAAEPFDDTFEEIGYGGYMRRRLPSADEQE